MKKEDIKSGMVVKLRKGCWCLALTQDDVIKFVSKEWIESDIDDYNDLLECQSGVKSVDFSHYDIVGIGTARSAKQLLLNDEDFDIIWTGNDAKEMTVEEVEKELGYKIKIVK